MALAVIVNVCTIFSLFFLLPCMFTTATATAVESPKNAVATATATIIVSSKWVFTQKLICYEGSICIFPTLSNKVHDVFIGFLFYFFQM